MNAANGSTLAPGWLEQFRSSPAEALGDLLLGRAWLGALAGGDPAEALLDLAGASAGDATFRPRLDEAAAEWLDSSFGKPPPCHTGRWASALRGAFLAVEELELASAARLLRGDVDSWRSYLRSFYDGPSQDPESAYLRAVAANQEDRQLVRLWYSVCRLEPSLPPHVGLVGILGLRWLPAENGSPPPDINPEVSQGLLLLGTALVPFAAEGKAEFQRVLRLTRAAYPRSPETWAEILDWGQQEQNKVWQTVNAWVTEAFPELVVIRLKQHFEGPARAPSAAVDLSSWPRRDRQIASRLSSGSWRPALQDARRLLDEELSYARATGDSYNFVRSACNFSGRLLGKDNDRAMEWLREAFEWEPHNPYVHSHLATCLKESGRLAEAEATLCKAVRQFPGSVTLRTQLADVLKVQGRLSEAEAEYRETVRLFPGNRFARSGLAEVLLAQERLDEAEKECRKTTELFPADAVAHSSLARVLLARGELDGAEAECLETKRLFPNDPFAHTGLAEVLKARGALDEAEVAYRHAVVRFPREPVVRAGHAAVLKAQGRLVEAEARYREAKRLFPGDPVVRTGLAEVLKAMGRLEDAEAEYREALALFPHDLAARTGLAEVLKALGFSGAAEALYRHAKREFPASTVTRCGLGHVLRRMARRDAREGRAEQAAGRRREAHALFQSVLRDRPADSYALAGEGFLLLDEGQPQEAVALFEDASRRYPGLDVFAYGLMRARRESGECLPEAAWESMASRAQRIPSVVRLEHARASLAAGNLHVAGAQVRRLLEEFIGARRPHRAGHGDVSTAEWYAQSLGRLLFQGGPRDALADGLDIGEVLRRLRDTSTEIDEITEQYAMAA